ncbi:MAG: hypothetical protein FWE29_05635 [Defluviitaleaceae bacterium]|nr:hypothetical protein [Defluviitaleaceae bacterium]
MAQEKLSFEQFITAVNTDHQKFIQDLHNYMLDKDCKATFEEKKSGYLASYKFGKPKRSVVNFLLRKAGMLVRIYGENTAGYLDFLDTLPEEMVQAISESGACKRLVYNTCSPKCKGYDFMVKGDHFQKCRYNCFEFLVKGENNPYIKSFIDFELRERAAR